ncbi:MAG: ABC-2 family transporter protein [Desulfobacterales bacterium]|nr:MAG: ABC-2 family transporter protein [Desulfobacterales bacterium]
MSTLRRYLQLFGLFIKMGLMRQMAYRLNFFMMVIGKIIRIGLLILFFQAIFLKIDRIGEWNYDQVLLLFATFHFVDYVMSITFQRNLAFQLPRRIQMGELDARMILPVNLLFMVSFEDIDMIDFFSFLPSLGFLGYVFYRLDFAFSWAQLLIYVLLLINALVFLFSVILIITTISFWTTQSYGLARIFDNLLRICRYPLDIFEGFWKAVFIYILPLVLIAQIPSQALLKLLAPGALFGAFAVTGMFLGLALVFWNIGLKNYMSAST